MITTFQSELCKCNADIIDLICLALSPAIVYQLGFTTSQKKQEGLFIGVMPTFQKADDFILLVLASDLKGKTVFEWQERLENLCAHIARVTVIVLETATFNSWLTEGHLFACKVYNALSPVYQSSEIHFDPPTAIKDDSLENQKFYQDGINKAIGFLANADLSRVRNDSKLAAFMLHQSAEQTLRTLLKIGTGFHCCTHNLDRLMRYCGLVTYQLEELFPRKNEEDKRLFGLIQKAYIDSRYKEDYKINQIDLIKLTDRVRALQTLLQETAPQLLQNRRLATESVK